MPGSCEGPQLTPPCHPASGAPQQSSITGEPDAVPATVAHQSPEPLQANNLLFASSLVVNGEGLGVVFRTGSGTMIASISALASGAAAVLQQTLLQREIMRLARAGPRPLPLPHCTCGVPRP